MRDAINTQNFLDFRTCLTFSIVVSLKAYQLGCSFIVICQVAWHLVRVLFVCLYVLNRLTTPFPILLFIAVSCYTVLNTLLILVCQFVAVIFVCVYSHFIVAIFLYIL